MTTAIDLFAGAGGFTSGAVAAGLDVLWAANHWPAAVDAHRANHPDVDHVCQDLHQADWTQVPRPDVVLASPACQGHSRARGKDRPHHDVTRSSAWAVVSCAEYHRPAFVIVENVPEFLRWKLYPAFELAMKSLGYSISTNVLDAADFGVPQNRVRVFLIFSRSSSPVVPRIRSRRPVPASSFIDWDLPTNPIMKPGRSRNTIRKIEAGREDHGDRFLLPYYGRTRTGRSVDRPVGTITTRDRWAVIDGPGMRMLSVDEVRAAMGFPADYALPPTRKLAVHLLGNAVCPPVVESILREVVR